MQDEPIERNYNGRTMLVTAATAAVATYLLLAQATTPSKYDLIPFFAAISLATANITTALSERLNISSNVVAGTVVGVLAGTVGILVRSMSYALSRENSTGSTPSPSFN